MPTKVHRQAVDLSAYPDLVVIYLGMRVNMLYGLKTFLGFGSSVPRAVAERPDGLLLHENVLFSLFPPHLGFRQYWRDYASLEAWTRSPPHRDWWQRFLRDSGGTGFWHEAYFLRGGMEAIYDDMVVPLGFMKFAPVIPARGPAFDARQRLRREGQSPAAPLTERELYDETATKGHTS